MPWINAISENASTLIPLMTILGGVIGKLISDQGKKSLVKEVAEANAALTAAAKNFAPCWDLAFNIGAGKVPLDEANLKKLKNYAATSWTDAQNLSREAKDVLDQFAVARGVAKP